jgi:ABC-type antimicrobial peptide transport system permease subunit
MAIALTVTIYSVVRSALLEPLPYPGAERMYSLRELRTDPKVDTTTVAPPVFLAWRDQAGVFEEIAAYAKTSFAVVGAGEPVRAEGIAASAALFPLLGVRFEAGRGFSAMDDRPGAASVIVISSRFWRRQLGGNPDVLQERLSLDGQPYQVVGVTDAALEVPGATSDFIVPLTGAVGWSADIAGAKYLEVVARLRSEVAVAAALERLSAISQRVPDNEKWRAHMVPLREQVTGSSKNALVMLFAAVIAVLLIASATAANLLIARTPERAREMAIRAALGASRIRLTRLIMTDAVLLALTAGVLGLTLAAWATELVVAISPEVLPRRAMI